MIFTQTDGFKFWPDSAKNSEPCAALAQGAKKLPLQGIPVAVVTIRDLSLWEICLETTPAVRNKDFVVLWQQVSDLDIFVCKQQRPYTNWLAKWVSSIILDHVMVGSIYWSPDAAAAAGPPFHLRQQRSRCRPEGIATRQGSKRLRTYRAAEPQGPSRCKWLRCRNSGADRLGWLISTAGKCVQCESRYRDMVWVL